MSEEETKYVVRTSPKSKQTTLILCVCLGWIADMIKVATGSYKDGAGEPIRK